MAMMNSLNLGNLTGAHSRIAGGVAVDAPSVRQWGRVLNLTSPDTARLPAASRDLIRK
jgi:hypothetical protein